MRFPLPLTLPFIAAFSATLLVGLSLGAGVATFAYDSALTEATQTNTTLLSMNRSQSELLAVRSLEFDATAPGQVKQPLTPPMPAVASAALIQDAPIETAPAQTEAPILQAKASEAPAANAKPSAAAVAHPAPSPRVVAKVVVKPVPVISTPQPAQPTRPITPTAASPVSAAPSSAGITMEQAGIAGIDSASVRFRSGRLITVGGEFPSGEKLISVNPAEGRFVTDRRTIQLIKPQPQP